MKTSGAVCQDLLALWTTTFRAMASDDTYIYVGLQKGGLFYTSNKGNKWVNFSQGYPKMEQMGNIYLTPTQLFATTTTYMFGLRTTRRFEEKWIIPI